MGTFDEESLLRRCDMIADRDTAGAFFFVDELSGRRGQDLGRRVTDMLEYLRHLSLVQHTDQPRLAAGHQAKTQEGAASEIVEASAGGGGHRNTRTAPARLS